MNNLNQIKCEGQNIIRCKIFNYQLSIINFFSLLLIFLFLTTVILHSQEKPYWKKTEGIYGGTITCITGNDYQTFIGTLGAGVYKSSYWQESWEPLNNGLTDLDIRAIILTKNNILLAGTYGSGIFRSTDFGDGWSSANAGITTENFRSFAQDSDGTIWAGSYYGGIFFSINDGTSWQNGGLNDFDIWSIAVSNNAKIFAGTKSGIVVSTDKGFTWNNANYGLTTNDVRTIVLAADTLYAGTAKGVFRSSDDGVTWIEFNDSLTNLDVWALLPYDYGQLYVGTRGDGVYFWSSFFGRYCWRKQTFLSDDVWVRCLEFGGGGIIYAGTGDGDGVFRATASGALWNNMNEGINNLDVSSLAINTNGTLFAGTATSGIYKSIYDIIYWQPIQNDLKNEDIFSVAIDSNNNIYVGTYGSGVFRSDNDGDSFVQLDEGLVDRNIFSLVVDKRNRIIAGTGGGGIYRYETDSSKWVQKNNGVTNRIIYSIIKAPNGFLFAGTPGGGIFKSENDGDSWIQSNIGLSKLFVNTISASANGDIIAGTDGGGAFISKDNGDSWSYIELTGTDIRSIVFAVDGYTYIGTRDNGIYRSKLDSIRWELVNDGLITNSVQALIADNKGRLFAAVQKNGVYIFDPATGVDDNSPDNNDDITIFPNPVQEQLNIEINRQINWGMGNGGWGIEVYNLLGLQVKKINIVPGLNKYAISLKDLPNGIYFINYNSKSKPLIILR